MWYLLQQPHPTNAFKKQKGPLKKVTEVPPIVVGDSNTKAQKI